MMDTEDAGGSFEPAVEDARLDDGPGEGEGFDAPGESLEDVEEALAEVREEEAGLARPRRSARERIDALTREKHDARREAEHWRELAFQAEAETTARAELERHYEELAGRQASAQPAPYGEDGRPLAEAYPHGVQDPAYVEDLAAWKADQAIDRRLAEAARQQAKAMQNHVWETRKAEASQARPDYYEVVDGGAARNAWACSPVMAQAIRSSDAGAEVAYHLATHPAEARRISRLDALAQVRELGRIEGRVARQSAPYRTATDAPTPPPEVRAGGSRFAVDPATADFRAFETRARKVLGGP